VNNTVEEPRAELVLRPNRAALADYGLTVGQVGQLVRTSIEGTVAGVYRGEAGRERDIRVRLAEDARARTAQIGDLQVRTPRGTVPLTSLGQLVEQVTPTAIQRVDRVRTVQIDAQFAGSLTDAVAALEAAMAEIPLQPGYTWRVTGDFEQFSEAAGSVLIALLLAITLTYIVLAMILESFVHPFTVMLTLPLGAVGAILALFLWGTSMNIFSMMAIIMLVGIVVNNAILILDYPAILRRRDRGAARGGAGPPAPDRDDQHRDRVRAHPAGGRHRRGCGLPRADGHRHHGWRPAVGRLHALPDPGDLHQARQAGDLGSGAGAGARGVAGRTSDRVGRPLGRCPPSRPGAAFMRPGDRPSRPREALACRAPAVLPRNWY
jgi:hypothetical protein